MPGAQGLSGSRATAAEAPAWIALEPEAKASLATLVAHLLLHEVDGPTLEVLRQEGVLEVLEKLEPGCRDYLAGREWGPADFDSAAAEYCRLFILPRGVPPYASAWLGGDPLVAGPRVAARAAEVRRALGLEGAGGNPPDDHLGVLLTFLARAWQAGPAGEPVARVLTGELLLPWTPAFSEALEREADGPLYRALGSLLGQLSRGLL